MNHAMFLTPAVNCVQALQKGSIAHEQPFLDPVNASLASAISTLAHVAQFIENTVQSNNKLHNIGILIACQVRKVEEREPSKEKTFLMWNSIAERRKQQHSSVQVPPPHPKPSFSEHRKHSRPPPQVPLQHPYESLERSELPDTSLRSEKPPVRLEQPKPLQNVQPSETPPAQASPQKGNDERSSGKCSYSVPVDVAAKCLGLLLDGSGFSAHRHLFQKRSYTELGTKPLVDVLKQVFKAESGERSNKKPAFSSSNTSSKDVMIYCDLLPDYLKKAQDNDNILVVVPEIVLEEKGNITFAQFMKVKMNIRKPDRNKKDQNFAVLCALLAHTGPTGICARTFREYARHGFTAEGCRRRKKYSTSAKSSCNGSQTSCQERRKLCSFFIISYEIPIGKGTVCPYATEIDGKTITAGCVLIRFTQARLLEDIKIPSDLSMEQKKSMHHSWMHGSHTIWPTSGIERIELLGDYGKVIGTGIYVRELVQKDAQDHVLKRIRRLSSKRNSMDMINAFIVSDVVLTDMDTEAPPVYPYMEWYNLSCFKPLQILHFDGDDSPRNLTPSVVRSAKALLWNKNHYRNRK